MRVVFLGTPDFAVPTLERLCASRHEVVHVITQPDRPRGRGQQVQAPPVKVVAQAHGIPVSQPDTWKGDDVLNVLVASGADIGVVAAYGKIIPERHIHALPNGMINVHASLLPRWRGAAPIQRAVIAGDRETGITIMRVVKALDAGAMLAVARRAIGEEERAGDVEADLSRIGGTLLVDTLDRLEADGVEEVAQPEDGVTYAAKMTRDDSPIDWSRPAAKIHDQVRGLHPWPLANTWLAGERLIVLRSRVAGAAPGGTTPGTIVRTSPALAVVAGDGALVEIIDVQPEGKRPMPASAFVAGRRLTVGAVFGAPPGPA